MMVLCVAPLWRPFTDGCSDHQGHLLMVMAVEAREFLRAAENAPGLQLSGMDPGGLYRLTARSKCIKGHRKDRVKNVVKQSFIVGLGEKGDGRKAAPGMWQPLTPCRWWRKKSRRRNRQKAVGYIVTGQQVLKQSSVRAGEGRIWGPCRHKAPMQWRRVMMKGSLSWQ